METRPSLRDLEKLWREHDALRKRVTRLEVLVKSLMDERNGRVSVGRSEESK